MNTFTKEKLQALHHSMVYNLSPIKKKIPDQGNGSESKDAQKVEGENKFP